MARWSLTLGALLAVASCQDETPGALRQAITTGTPTSGDPAVVALVLGGRMSCSATLIAPRVILTAAHCLPQTGTRPTVRFGADAESPVLERGILASRVHPAFDRVTLTHDIGVALLDGLAPDGVTPAVLPDRALEGTAVGASIRVVGFGETAVDAGDLGVKREGIAIVDALEATTFTLRPAPSQPCHGDSGGPAFLTVDGLERLVGVTSAGDLLCSTFGRDVRVDAYLDAFIQPFVEATADASVVAGGRCYYEAQCAAGSCVPALDDPALAFCAVPCGVDGACPDGLACLVAADGREACFHEPPSPGALGAPCATGDDCAAGLCAAEPGEAAQCTLRCFPGALECPAGFDCVTYDEGRGASACFSHEPGGCNAAAGPGGLAPLLVLAVCGFIRTKNKKGVRT